MWLKVLFYFGFGGKCAIGGFISPQWNGGGVERGTDPHSTLQLDHVCGCQRRCIFADFFGCAAKRVNHFPVAGEHDDLALA